MQYCTSLNEMGTDTDLLWILHLIKTQVFAYSLFRVHIEFDVLSVIIVFFNRLQHIGRILSIWNRFNCTYFWKQPKNIFGAFSQKMYMHNPYK